jgi:threonine dehydrogenase-like Zn-dependent dehydrogenase
MGMRALTVSPGIADSARIEDVEEPPLSDGSVLARTLALGVCGTDREILEGYGAAPPGEQRLILGHESLAKVETAPRNCDLAPGDLIVGIVRRPDPLPCSACAAGEWDMCRNGRYTERGIKERHGYGAERFRIEPEFAIKIDPALGILGVLLEPASILAKAWDHAERIGQRARAWEPRVLVVTGVGPIGLLAALMGAQRGLSVHVLGRDRGGAKEQLVRDLGGSYHVDAGILDHLAPDILMECTGAPSIIQACLASTAPAGITCLTGVTQPGKLSNVDIGGLNRTMVLDNDCVFGSVNANRRHYEMAAQSLARADRNWLRRFITRRVPLERATEALEQRSGDIKVIVDFAPTGSSTSGRALSEAGVEDGA